MEPKEHSDARAEGEITTPDAQSRAAERVITDVEEYRQRLVAAGSSYSQLDRSDIFRYEKHFAIFEKNLRARLEAGTLPVRMLVIGVGNMQEPMSYLAVAQKISLETGKPLSDIVQMDTIDVRPKEEVESNLNDRHKNYFGLGKNQGGLGMAFASAASDLRNAPLTPNKPKKGREHAFKLSGKSGEYEFVESIQAYVRELIADEKRARFSTPVENAEIQEYDEVSCNNVLQHMGGPGAYPSPFKNKDEPPEAYARYYAEVEKILRRVKVGGTIFIGTDGLSTNGGESEEHLQKIPYYNECFEQVRTGVHKRVR